LQAQHPVEAKRKLKSTFGAHVIAPDSRPTESTHAADNCRVAADSLSPKHTVPAPAHTPAAKHTTEQLLTNRLLAPLCAYFSSTQPDTAHTRQLACHLANTNQTFSRARMMSLPTVHKHSAHLCKHSTTHTHTSSKAQYRLAADQLTFLYHCCTHFSNTKPDAHAHARQPTCPLLTQPDLACPRMMSLPAARKAKHHKHNLIRMHHTHICRAACQTKLYCQQQTTHHCRRSHSLPLQPPQHRARA
jgi:hypothetical protein